MDSSVISFCDNKGIRVDRVFECELLRKAVGTTLCVAYKYRYYSEKTTYRVAFKTDAVKRGGRRVMWIHKDEENGTTEAQAIVQNCEEDSMQFAVNLFSLRGMVDAESIEFEQPQTYATPEENIWTYDHEEKKVKSSDNCQKIFANLSRVCELEDAVVEWYDQRYYPKKRPINIAFMDEIFNVKLVEYAGMDRPILKAQCVASKPGYLEKPNLGIGVRVLPRGTPVNNELKNAAFLIDRSIDIELRVGDYFIVYISKGGP